MRGRIVLIGGGKILSREFDWLDDFFLECRGDAVIIPGKSANDEKWIRVAQEKLRRAGVRGVVWDGVGGLNLETVRILFVLGGRPDKLMEVLTSETETISRWFARKTSVYVGVSAGALIAGKKCVITKDENYVESRTVNGLGLMEQSVEVHYTRSQDTELRRLGMSAVLCLPDNSAVIISGEKVIWSIGAVHLWKNS